MVLDGLNYPQADGSAGQFLKTDGSGQLAFATVNSEVVNDSSPQLGADLASNGNDILFADNDKAIFGTGSDLQIYHSGSGSSIDDVGTGNFNITTNGAGIYLNKGGSENMASFLTDGAVTLFYDNSAKLATSSSGVSVTGDFVASGNVTAYSDQRLKDNIETISGALSKVRSMRGVTFTKDGEKSSGVIAQELEKVAPELVANSEYKSVAYGNLVGYLIEAVKELSDKVKELEAHHHGNN